MSLSKLPLVSICIICYNHEKYISKALESCINQTYENIEIIIVDNASADNSAKIIEQYTQENENITFYPLLENTFPSYASNYAIKKSHGEYIAILSTDDFFELDKIEIQLKYMLENTLTNSFTWIHAVNDANEKLLNTPIEKNFNQQYTPNEIKKYFVLNQNVLCATTCMLHRSCFDKYGYFDNRLIQSQDHELWLRILKYEDIHVLPLKLTNYRVRDAGKNLSINMNVQAKNRSLFESIHFGKHVLDFDLDILTETLGISCTDENKYKNLFNFYETHNQPIFANAILFAMYAKLGSDFEFPSKLYTDFFHIYSQHDLLKDKQINDLINTVNKKDEQIIELNTLAHNLQKNCSIKQKIKSLLGLNTK